MTAPDGATAGASGRLGEVRCFPHVAAAAHDVEAVDDKRVPQGIVENAGRIRAVPRAVTVHHKGSVAVVQARFAARARAHATVVTS